MAKGFMFGSSINIWVSSENEWVKIVMGTCRDPSLVLIYGPCRVCLVV
jgi:hypothetical protein